MLISKTKIEWRYGWLCAALAILSVCVTAPFVEMGVNDDFSYTQIALHLAQSGKFAYNGWNTPMIGLQAYWAAWLIQLFGFSFTLVRLSTLPFVAGCAVLLYFLARKVGLNASFSMFFSCFVTLSPLSIPVAASFMTDIPALFFLLLCMVAALNALTAVNKSRFAFWVMTLALAGVLGGTIRQIVWLAPAILLPYIAVRERPGRTGAVVAVFWAASIGCAMFFSSWFRSQPYTVALPLIPSERVGLIAIASNLAGLYLEFLVLFLPILLLCLPILWRISAASRVVLAIGSAAAAFLCVMAPRFFGRLPSLPFGYFGGNIVTQNGVLMPGVEVLGDKPLTLPGPLQILLLGCALALHAICIAALVAKLPRQWKLFKRPDSPAVLLQHLFLLFTAPYLVAVISRSVAGQGIDRYLLPLLAIFGLLVLLQLPDEIRIAPQLGWIAMAVFAFYGVATTHDYFACSKARLEAARLLENVHIPRQQITAGLEFDGWTEIDRRGHINDARITNPRDAYAPQSGRTYSVEKPYWFWAFTPSVHPAYCIAISPLPHLAESGFQPVPYTTWLPPFRRKVLIQVDPAQDGPLAHSFTLRNRDQNYGK